MSLRLKCIRWEGFKTVIGELTRKDKDAIINAYGRHIKGENLNNIKMTDFQREALLKFEKASGAGKFAEQISKELGISAAFCTEMRKVRKTALHQVTEMRATRSPVRAEILMQKYDLKNIFPSVVEAYRMRISGDTVAQMQIKRVSESSLRKIRVFDKCQILGETIAETAKQAKITESEVRAMRKILKDNKEMLKVNMGV